MNPARRARAIAVAIAAPIDATPRWLALAAALVTAIAAFLVR